METCADCGKQFSITEGHVCGPKETKAGGSDALLIAALEHAGVATETSRIGAMSSIRETKLRIWADMVRELALGRIEWESSPQTSIKMEGKL